MGPEITQLDMATAPEGLLAELADFYVVIEDEEIPGDPPMTTEARIADWRQVSVHYSVVRWVLRDEDGIVVLLDGTPPQDQHDVVRESALVCPGAAIHLIES